MLAQISLGGNAMLRRVLAIFSASLFVFVSGNMVSAQIVSDSTADFESRSVFQSIDTATQTSQVPLKEVWWQPHITKPFNQLETLPTDIHTALFLALQNSHRIQVAKQDPLIRQTAIQEADANFDWVKYLNSSWNDSSEPIGNQLTAGGTVNRFEDHTAQVGGGLRRTNEYGGSLDIGQQFGWQNNNSQFLSPQNQATGRFVVSYTQPLMRGRGQYYNTSIVFLASMDSQVARNEFLAVLQDELFEITQAYWQLYLERCYLTQQISLYLKTKKIKEFLEARQQVDVQPSQLVAAKSALANRRADLIRARTAVTNAETRLRGLINAPQLSSSDQIEILPSEVPTMDYFPATNQGAIQTALQTRPELAAAMGQVKSAARRLGIARQDMLPALNLVTQVSGAGLRGDSRFARSFADQFSRTPSYSIGLQYEIPIGNRAAKARVARRHHEIVRLRSEYARAVEAVRTEVDVAVREVNTTYQEIAAKSQAFAAAQSEAETIEQRWLRMVDGPGSASLNLESLLRAMERMLTAEQEYADSIIAYNLALLRLKRAEGTLLQSENVTMTSGYDQGWNALFLHKGQTADTYQDTGVYLPATPEHEAVPIELAPPAAMEEEAAPLSEAGTGKDWAPPQVQIFTSEGNAQTGSITGPTLRQ